MLLSSALLALSGTLALASPFRPRAAPDNTVVVRSENEYCMIVPRNAHTDIGASESPGQMRSYCSAAARTDDSQGLFPDNFWRQVTYKEGNGANGQKYAQLTGCFNPGFSQFNDNDGGGQYDSSGGDGGRGNPEGSVCQG
ncbi:allergen protein [Ceratobasidium sp. AG-Ba]|nr:allergen protein [Ceratobasidium sp. AG-Ba]